jgi:aspartokinase/homoserine dehydrogenase 1
MVRPWVVHKFGGTSLADPEAFRRAADIVLSATPSDDGDTRPRAAVVVSASAGVTDALIGLSRTPPGELREGAIQGLRERQLTLASALLDGANLAGYAAELETELVSLGGLLDALDVLGVLPEEAAGLVAGYGEYWSARLMAALLRASAPGAAWLDARAVLTVTASELGPVVEWDVSADALAEWFAARGEVAPVVVTGFVARTPEGRPTTLGRNGSDFTASIFGALLDAREVNIWTDVDGVMSGDPRVVREARTVPRLSYDEAMELAYFGARVLHPATMAPLVNRGIPLRIRSTFAPGAEGTRIDGMGSGESGARGITVIDDMALLNVQGAGMIGVPGTADRLFGALRAEGISVVLISQGSSEHSICFAVPADDAATARQVVSRAFAVELAEGQIQSVEIEPGCAILAVVGDGMRGVPGVAARMFGALGRAGVNVRAIAQGASERNISAVISAADGPRALRAVHGGFYLSPRTLSIGLVGPGGVGREFLVQLSSEVERLRSESGVDLRLRGIANSRTMALADPAIDLSDWETALSAGEPVDLDAFADHLRADDIPHAVIIDCTASEATSARYAHWLARGIHVVTANKKAGSGSRESLAAIRAATQTGHTRFLYETTAGAGLPIIGTLQDLRETGDRIHSVEGMLSGTLAYLFNTFDGSRPFSAIVREALERGYTEPDPRDDLSGMDVARKVVILAREMGLDLELTDVEVHSLVPDELARGSVEEFLARLPEVDGEMAARLEAATHAGQVLRFVGRVEADGSASVGLASLPKSHAFAHGALTDNVVQYTTGRYSENPLVVQGPGAGREVTAAGVFADLLRLATSLGDAW